MKAAQKKTGALELLQAADDSSTPSFSRNQRAFADFSEDAFRRDFGNFGHDFLDGDARPTVVFLPQNVDSGLGERSKCGEVIKPCSENVDG